MVVSWNAQAPGRRALDAVVDEVNSLVHKEIGERRADIICMQEIAAAAEAKGDSPETPGYSWISNDTERGWDCAVAIRAHLERTIKFIKLEKHWIGVVLRRDGERIAVVNAHMPTSWAEGDAWIEAATQLRSWLAEVRDELKQTTIILAGDWNMSLDNVEGAKGECMGDIVREERLYAPPQTEWTHEWILPSSLRRCCRRIDGFWTSQGAWQVSAMLASRSDHRPLLLHRAGRPEIVFNKSKDDRHRLARTRGWTPTSW